MADDVVNDGGIVVPEGQESRKPFGAATAQTSSPAQPLQKPGDTEAAWAALNRWRGQPKAAR